MSEEALAKNNDYESQWYEQDIPIRGCHLSFSQIKNAYRELSVLTKSEGEKIVDKLDKLEGESEEEFTKRKEFLKLDAFKVTVSIVGFDGQTVYGETETVFDSSNLPIPIKTIFFTNETSYRRNANRTLPNNRFSFWINFDKPPLFDPNPLVSSPTHNDSKAEIKAEDVIFFRAVQNILSEKLSSNKKWYSFVHEKFAYDAGVWLIAIPYALYWITIYSDSFFRSDDNLASFRIAFYIYASGLSLLFYRGLFSYIKWAFPVNILEENKDHATRHRLLLGAIMLGLIVSGVNSMIKTFAGF
ncbi:hypothetical protein NBZ79_18300 [Sneathiella marina]|uniref:Uncharacterized protein n=1 Tax=Sneathiella marina TaxID=2950108 RepID=A0ABY4W2S3_9PROT|nr:hypothetical protein [Sneathiella marina]USG61111.1 hypothetical protein NBZ79_18300 [Sneathiella marina]